MRKRRQEEKKDAWIRNEGITRPNALIPFFSSKCFTTGPSFQYSITFNKRKYI